MEFIKKIPVIGYLVRLVVAIAKLPKHLDRLYEQNEQLRVREDALRDAQEGMRQMQESLVQWNQDRMEEIRRINNMVTDLQQLNVGADYIKKLNLITSIHPTIWGDEEKLHISKTAAVFSCTLNTNSGHITVGDYTFAGSGVSILAGSHDMQLTGFLRRDAEITEGCDITIGEGVWLASNSTILGPATIGDHAVVAAGAIVAPGTVIPPNTVYGGVPAKCLGEICPVKSEEKDAPAVRNALERNKGVLFVKGWSEKKVAVCEGKTYIGHFLTKDTAEIYVKTEKLTLAYRYEYADEICLRIRIDDREEEIYRLAESSGTLLIPIETAKQDVIIHTITMTVESPKTELFIASI